MSRPGRRSGDDLAYGDYNRWDRDRFDRSGRLPPMPPEPPRGFEEDFRFVERDRPGRRDVLVEDRTESRGPRGRIDERERIFRETFGDGGRRRTDRELFGDVDPREIADMAVTPYKNRGAEKEIDITIKESRGARPGIVRRQSSLDTFDRRPIPRYDRDDYRIAPYQPIPLPIRRREEEELRGREDDTYREVEVKRERSVHRRSGKKSRVSVSSSSSSETEIEEIKSKVSRAAGFKKGKTRVPKRLVFKEAIMDLGYPFIEEDHFYILQVALEKEQIDEVIKISETYKSAGKHKSFRYEEKIEEDSESVSKIDDRRGRETIIRKEYINPPSDFLGTELPNRSRSSRRAHSPSIESSISQRTGRSRARSSFREERRTVIEEGQSRSRAPTIVIPGIVEERVPAGALILQEREHRSDAEIKAEILALEAERRALRFEREGEMQVALVREERPVQEIVKIVERERSPPRNVLRVEKDRKERRQARIVAAAMATLT